MNRFVPSFICFALMVFFYLLYEGNKYSKRFSHKLGVFIKCAATLCCTALAAIGYAHQMTLPSLYILLGLICCTVADGMLEHHFVAGMGIFGAGHILYIIGCIRRKPPQMVNYIVLSVLLILLAVSMLFFKRSPLSQKAREKGLPGVLPPLLYGTVLLSMLAFSLTQTPTLMLGAALFVLSDVTLARNLLLGATRKQDYVSLGCYYLGQFLIALSTLI